MATRQPARFVGKLLTFTAFAKPLESDSLQPTKLTAKVGLNKTWAKEQNKKAFQIVRLFEKKADGEKLAGDYRLKIIHALRKPQTLLFAIRSE